MNELPRNFETDLLNSSKVKNWPETLNKLFKEKNTLHDFADNLNVQLKFGTDITLTTPKGRRYSIELKTRDNKYYLLQNWLLEVIHQRYTNKDMKTYLGSEPGWLYKCTAEILVYGTLNKEGDKIIEACAFTLSPFKDEGFRENITVLKHTWSPTLFANGIFQLTLNKFASKEFLSNNAHNFWYCKEVL